MPEYERHLPFSMSSKDSEKYAPLIASCKEKVECCVHEQAVLNAEAGFGGFLINGLVESDGDAGRDALGKAGLRPVLAFVEGFLVLADPTPIDETPGPKPFDLSSHKALLANHAHAIEKIDDDANRDHTHLRAAQRPKHCKRIWDLNRAARVEMRSLFSTKLFLSTPKALAKARRFSRPEYIDASAGGQRIPGQMWKTEGYFEDVVWPEHVIAHEWFIKSGEDGQMAEGPPTSKGVFVCDGGSEDDVMEKVEWALEVILSEMARTEGVARDQARRAVGSD